MLDVKKLIAKILAWIVDKSVLTCTIELANSSVMTDQGSVAKAIHISGDAYLVAFGIIVKTTTARTNLAIARIKINGQPLTAWTPWFFQGKMDSSSTFLNCFGNTTAGGWIDAPGTWNANQTYRISGVGLFRI